MRVSLLVVSFLLLGSAVARGSEPTPPSKEQAEMMGRVEWVTMNGGRDVTAESRSSGAMSRKTKKATPRFAIAIWPPSGTAIWSK